MKCPHAYTRFLLSFSFLFALSRNCFCCYLYYHHHQVPFVFHNEYIGFGAQEDRDMSDVLTTFWGSFIAGKTHDPNSKAVGLQTLSAWPAYTSEGQAIILLPNADAITVAGSEFKSAECAFLIPKIDASIKSTYAGK